MNYSSIFVNCFRFDDAYFYASKVADKQEIQVLARHALFNLDIDFGNYLTSQN